MFSKAIEKTLSYIRPVVTTNRHYDESVTTNGGTLVIINKEGWFISASHVFESIPLFRRHEAERAEYEKKLEEIKGSNGSKKDLKKLKYNPKWITASSIWPGTTDQKIVDISVIPEADILIGRLDPFDPSTISEYPSFKYSKKELPVGRSLCKLGFAFSEIEASFDKVKGSFNLDFKNLVPFPLDGIYTRNILFKTPLELERRGVIIKYIETSTPGLRGHSGCPLFDTDGAIWGIQSRTSHLPLGFSPSVEKLGRTVEENQFLNVGWAVHPDVIYNFFKERDVSFSLAD